MSWALSTMFHPGFEYTSSLVHMQFLAKQLSPWPHDTGIMTALPFLTLVSTSARHSFLKASNMPWLLSSSTMVCTRWGSTEAWSDDESGGGGGEGGGGGAEDDMAGGRARTRLRRLLRWTRQGSGATRAGAKTQSTKTLTLTAKQRVSESTQEEQSRSNSKQSKTKKNSDTFARWRYFHNQQRCKVLLFAFFIRLLIDNNKVNKR